MAYYVDHGDAFEPTTSGHQRVKPVGLQLASGLFGLILFSYLCYAVTVTDQMVTKALDTTSCSVPVAASTFLTTDQTAYLFFDVGGANAGDVPTATWYGPNGA